jgi:hypothetical protein
MKENLDFKNKNLPITEDFELPTASIEDVDRAVFNLFDKTLPLQVLSNGEVQKVPVVFAAGERFALTRRKNPIRDDNNTLILPIISITRADIDFSPDQQGRGSAISTRDQQSYIVKKRLSAKDRDYQNIINKLGIKNQKNVTSRNNFISNDISPGNVAKPQTITTRRNVKGLNFTAKGGIINLNSKQQLGDNIFEFIQVPYPIFVSIKYNVTIWCQYMSQMNTIQEIYLSSFKGRSEEFVEKSKTGLEYVIKSETSFSADNNFSNYAEEERVIKTNIGLVATGYIINQKLVGQPDLIRSSFSAPTIEFGYFDSTGNIVSKNIDNKNQVDKFILTDIESYNEVTNEPERGQSSEFVEEIIINPFTGEKDVSFSKVLNRNNRAGETVATNLIVKKSETQYE